MDTGSTSNRPPRLRRKSSAFKLSLSRGVSNSYAQAVQPPPTPSLPGPSSSSDPATTTTPQDYTFVLPSPTPSPTTSNPPDSPYPPEPSLEMFPQSAPSISTNPSAASSTTTVNSFPNVPSPSLTSTLELLKQLVTKRLTAWNYLKNVSQGKIYWFNTILLTKEELRQFFPNDKMRARTSRFTILSMSLSPILEIHQPNDFLRGLYNLVQEFESIPEEKFASLVTASGSNGTGGGLAAAGGFGFSAGGGIAGGGGGAGGVGTKSGQKSLFKLSSTKNRSKATSGTSTPAASSTTGTGSSIGGVASSSASIASNTSGGGGGGGADFAFGEGSETGYLFIPNIPFELDYLQVLTTTCELLIRVYSKISSYLGVGSEPIKTPSGGIVGTGGGGGVGALSQNLAEIVLKIDGKLKKLIALLSKEIDNLARIAIRNELDVLGGGVEGWGFENSSGLGLMATGGSGGGD
ncbi:uncharacterized protein JCM6883_001145 [Sporobolomyces salmoneus]|uniref:uncharacterized protein n=1 Tax=Sporobolomyces salmoneus TaxID=183962 RepID=UPI0031812708